MTKHAYGKSKTQNQENDRKRKAEDSDLRVEKWQTLTKEQRIQALDERLGVGVGAKKQRERILGQ